jgi:hypothetical protein
MMMMQLSLSTKGLFGAAPGGSVSSSSSTVYLLQLYYSSKPFSLFSSPLPDTTQAAGTNISCFLPAPAPAQCQSRSWSELGQRGPNFFLLHPSDFFEAIIR